MKTTLIYLFLACLIISACSKNDAIVNTTQDIEELAIDDNLINTLKQAKINPEEVSVEILEHPDGSKETVYFVEGDLYITPEKLENMAQNHAHGDLHNRQYCTDELVDNNQTIRVLGLERPGSSYSLSPDMKTALGWAINNYNALDIGLDFDLTIGNTSNFDNYDIVVYQLFNNRAGGSAGFPVDGAPHKWVRIFNLTEGYNNNVIEHVITHEIGHCLGLRHTDWFSRQSCGGPSGESPDPYGANFIQGTQPAYDPNSLMLACFDGDENGEFGYYDRKALQELY